MKIERLKFSLSDWWDFRQAAQCILPYGRKLIKCYFLLDSVSASGEPAHWGEWRYLPSDTSTAPYFYWAKEKYVTWGEGGLDYIQDLLIAKTEKYKVRFLGLVYQSGTQWYKATRRIGGIYRGEVLIPGLCLVPFKTLELYGRSVPFSKMAGLGNTKDNIFWTHWHEKFLHGT